VEHVYNLGREKKAMRWMGGGVIEMRVKMNVREDGNEGPKDVFEMQSSYMNINKSQSMLANKILTPKMKMKSQFLLLYLRHWIRLWDQCSPNTFWLLKA
jgi:hypothetical protein